MHTYVYVYNFACWRLTSLVAAGSGLSDIRVITRSSHLWHSLLSQTDNNTSKLRAIETETAEILKVLTLKTLRFPSEKQLHINDGNV